MSQPFAVISILVCGRLRSSGRPSQGTSWADVDHQNKNSKLKVESNVEFSCTVKNKSNNKGNSNSNFDKQGDNCDLKVLCTNVRSLTRGTKREELQMLVNSNNIDILGITETWGRPDIGDCEMDIAGFKLYRKDRATLNEKRRQSSTVYKGYLTIGRI